MAPKQPEGSAAILLKVINLDRVVTCFKFDRYLEIIGLPGYHPLTENVTIKR